METFGLINIISLAHVGYVQEREVAVCPFLVSGPGTSGMGIRLKCHDGNNHSKDCPNYDDCPFNLKQKLDNLFLELSHLTPGLV